MPQIKYLLFDCDNTLVLSEKWAFAGCALLSNEILKKHGVDHVYEADELEAEFVGMNFRGLLAALSAKHGFVMAPAEVDAYVSRELSTLTDMLSKNVEPCEHVNSVLAALASEEKYGLAVVSSSAMSRVVASLQKADQAKFFGERVYSAATSLPVPTSKPDPAIYLHACSALGVRPDECIAIEDSKSGATAAMRAGIHLVGYVGPYAPGKDRQRMEKLLKEETKAEEIMADWREFPEIIKRIESR